MATADSPTLIVEGLTEQLTIGGTGGGGCLTMKLVEHVAEFAFLILGSVMVALTE